MDIQLTDETATKITNLEDGVTYALQSHEVEICFSQSESEPTTFFYAKGVKFKKKEGIDVYVKASTYYPMPINIHIEEV